MALVSVTTPANATQVTTGLIVGTRNAQETVLVGFAVSIIAAFHVLIALLDGRGTCNSKGVCDCEFGYTGDSCECLTCEGEPVICNGHGRCTCNGNCVCDNGWKSSKENGVCDCPGNFSTCCAIYIDRKMP
jgi:hypothetical protein